MRLLGRRRVRRAVEQDGFAEVFATDDARIGVASFLENGPGKAVFTGR